MCRAAGCLVGALTGGMAMSVARCTEWMAYVNNEFLGAWCQMVLARHEHRLEHMKLM